jgi:flagella basal body P-ring formation protein FlgA
MKKLNFLILVLAFCAASCVKGFTASIPAALLHQIKVNLSQNLGVSTRSLSITILSSYPETLSGNLTLIPVKGLPKKGGIMTFPVNESGKRAYVTIQYHVFVPVLVAAHSIRQGGNLSGKVRLERKDAEIVPWNSCHSLRDIKNRETRFSISKGTILTFQDLRRIQLVHYGDLCSLIVEKGFVKIQTEAKALQSGRKGEMISAQVPGSVKTVYAKVVGPDLLEIYLPEQGGSAL